MKFRCQLFILGVVSVVGLTAAPKPAFADEASTEQQRLIAVLTSDAPMSEKAIACKKLAIVGTKDAVPALRPLLDIQELSSWARIALEVIPDPAADEALRDALQTVKGRQLVGVINSIGTRRDAQAVTALAKRLADADADIAVAAAVTLGKIGNQPATAALIAALSDARPQVRSAVAEGCVLSAEQLLAAGNATQASDLYDKVRAADVPKQRKREAIRGAILARKSEGIPLLVEQLTSGDKDWFGLGVQTARELPGAEVTQALVGQLESAPADRQEVLIAAIAQRDDEAVVPAILQAAKVGAPQVRAKAIEVLQLVGDASAVPVLLDIAVAADADLTAAVTESIANFSDEKVNQQIQARLPNAEGKLRRILIELAGLRRIEAVDVLIEAAGDSDPEIRKAALTALGSTVGLDKLDVLTSRVVASVNPEDHDAAIKALRAAAVRMPDREACAKQLAAALPQAPEAAQQSLLEILASVGGTTALESVGLAATDKYPELQDTATRVLGNWMTADAAPVLLKLAQTTKEPKYQVRALRGYLRIPRQFALPTSERVAMCRSALAAAQRDEERLLVLDVLKRFPCAETLALALEMAKEPALKDAANSAATEIRAKISADTGKGRKSP